MDSQNSNNYSQQLDLSLQLTINSGFLKLKDFYNLSKVDKFLNYISKKEVHKYIDILIKCGLLLYDIKVKYDLWHPQDLPTEYNSTKIYRFDPNHVCNMFGKQLNKNERAF